MIFVANKADFSAKKIGSVNFAYDDTEGDEGYTVLISSIQIKEVTESLKVGNKVQLKTIVFPLNAYMRTDLTWSVSDGSIASVSQSGLLTVLDSGNVTITATAKDGSEVVGSISLTTQQRGIEDITDETTAILDALKALDGAATYTDAQKVALDTLLVRIGVQYEDSIWSKIKFLMLPCLGTSVNNVFFNIKNKEELFAYQATTYRDKYYLQNGWLRTDNTSSTYAFPTYLNSNMNLYGISGKMGLFWMCGGRGIGLVAGGSGYSEHINCLFAGNRVGLTVNTGRECYADLDAQGYLRGASTDNTEDGTYMYPSEHIATMNFSGFDSYVARQQATEYFITKIKMYIQNKDYGIYCYCYGNTLTEEELNVLGNSLNRFFADYGVNTKLYT